MNLHFIINETNSLSPIYSHALWIGGVNSSGDLHLAADRYRGNQSEDFWHGPVGDMYANDFDETYNKVWKVEWDQIENHIENFNSPGYIIPEVFVDWPAHGNVENGEAEYLAPFVDVNNDGIYNPNTGDYPKIKGDKALFIIMNDDRSVHTNSGGASFGLEIHAMVYSYNCIDSSIPSINETVFMSLKFINRSAEVYSDVYIGNWSDYDLGTPLDDFAGYSVSSNMYYGYNADNYDEPSSASSGYGENPPAVGFKLLNNDYRSFIAYNNSGNAISGEPTLPIHYYNYLRGLWKDGSPLTYGGNGMGGAEETLLMCPSSPNDLEGWSMYQESSIPGDRKAIGASGPFDFSPGDEIVLDYAIIFAHDENLNHIENVDLLIDNAAGVQDVYDGLTNIPCLVNRIEMDFGVGNSSVFPNPGNSFITFESNEIGKVSVYNILGEIVYEDYKTSEKLIMNFSGITPGLYFVKSNNLTLKFFVN